MVVIFDLNRHTPAPAPLSAADAPLDTVMMITLTRRPATERRDAARQPHIPPFDPAERDAVTWEDAEWQ
jgi:hypothetical protein